MATGSLMLRTGWVVVRRTTRSSASASHRAVSETASHGLSLVFSVEGDVLADDHDRHPSRTCPHLSAPGQRSQSI